MFSIELIVFRNYKTIRTKSPRQWDQTQWLAWIHWPWGGFQMVKLINLRALKFKTRIVCSEKKKTVFERFPKFPISVSEFFRFRSPSASEKKPKMSVTEFFTEAAFICCHHRFHRRAINFRCEMYRSSGWRGRGGEFSLARSNYNLAQLVTRAGTSDRGSLVALHRFVSW